MLRALNLYSLCCCRQSDLYFKKYKLILLKKMADTRKAKREKYKRKVGYQADKMNKR